MTLIVKLGGSLITNKSKYRTFRSAETDSVISYLAQLEKEIVIVHGGGSYGHIKAEEYGIPGLINENTRNGFALIHHDMLSLNQEVSKLLLAHGFRPVPIAPANFIFGDSSNFSIFREYAKKGFMPVTFGDVYLKSDTEYGIYSGDTLVLDLAKIFHPEKVIFLSDVDGIYDRNPKLFSDAKLLDNPEEAASFESSVADVTGGIKRKLGIMKEVRNYAKSVHLMNGLHPERLLMLDSPDFIGTVIK